MYCKPCVPNYTQLIQDHNHLTWSGLGWSHWDGECGHWLRLDLDQWRLGNRGVDHRRGTSGHRDHRRVVTSSASDGHTVDHGDTVPAEGGDTLHHVDGAPARDPGHRHVGALQQDGVFTVRLLGGVFPQTQPRGGQSLRGPLRGASPRG